MSEPPVQQQNLEQQIPGLLEATSQLVSVTAKAGYRIDKILLVPEPTSRTSEHIQPQFVINQSQRPSQQMAAAAQQPGSWVQQISPSPLMIPSGDEITASPHTTTKPFGEIVTSPSRIKRSSTSILTKMTETTHAGKRKRLSEPPTTEGQRGSGAFWGTVLEERSGTPRGVMHSQPPHSQVEPVHPQMIMKRETSSNLNTPVIPPIQTIRSSLYDKLDTKESDVKRTSTFPAVRLRSPIQRRNQSNLIPSITQGTPTTAQLQVGEALPSPILTPTNQRRSVAERGFFKRTAGHLLDRLSPFGGNINLPQQSTLSPHRLPAPSQLQQQISATSGIPSYVTPIQRQMPIISSIPQQNYSPLVRETLPPLINITQQHLPSPYGQHSASRSASGSGVSYAQPSQATSPPHGSIADDTRLTKNESSTRGKRGRKAGAASDREQFFECEQCPSRFRRKSDKNRHVRVVHEKSRPFMCPICEKTFGEKSNMLKHRASVHDDVRTFRCPYCDATFSQRGLCDTHVRTVHDKKQAKYFCEHCGLPFSRKGQLHEHYQQSHPDHMAIYPGYGAGGSGVSTGMRSGVRSVHGSAEGTAGASASFVPPSSAQSAIIVPVTSHISSGTSGQIVSASTREWYPYGTTMPSSVTNVQRVSEGLDRQENVPGDSSTERRS